MIRLHRLWLLVFAFLLALSAAPAGQRPEGAMGHPSWRPDDAGIPVGMSGQPAGRLYHKVSIKDLATTRWTHVEVTGRVVYVRKQQDGDWHVTLTDADGVKAVLEIIPAIPLAVPRKGQVIRARGISRVDKHHAWGELHPLEWWEEIKR